jgi:polyhydroxyalkanoate synthesis regulator protein
MLASKDVGWRRAMGKAGTPLIIKRCGGMRLYDPVAAAYVSLGDPAAMIEDDEDFVVRAAATGEDITPPVLKQIIVERRRHG